MSNPAILQPIKSILRLAAGLCCLIWATGILQAQQTVDVTLDASKDNSIYSENTNSNGVGGNLFSGIIQTGPERRALLAFDLASLPADAVVTQASVRLVMDMTVMPAASSALHRVTADWGEGASDAPGAGGQGASPSTGDATWQHRFFNTQNWTSAGGDRVAAASASISVGGAATYTWTSAGLVQDVNDWLTGTAGNFGWILITSGGAKRFVSREGGSPAAVPKLILQYQTNTPAAPTALDVAAASDSGFSNTDDITMDDTPAITGNSGVGTTVKIFADGVEVGSGPGGAAFSITTSTLAEGVRSITATASDGGFTSPVSSPLAVTVDKTAPVAPAALDLATASDSGSSQIDNITNDGTPTIGGSAETGATVTVSSNVSGSLGSAVASGGAFSVTPGAAIAEGPHDLTATATDPAGNISGTSGILQVTIDTMAPAAPTGLDLLAGSDSGTSDADNLTNVQTVQITGDAETGATVTLTSNLDGNVGSGPANSPFTITTSALSAGTHAIKAKAEDVAGNTGVDSVALNVTVDIGLPGVTVNQAAGQADPTLASPILFTAVFSEPVTGFVNGDVTLGGSANPTTAVVAEIAPTDGTTYSISVSGMAGEGSVTASVGAGGAQDAANNGNAASSSTDNMVIFGEPPTVTINQGAGQSDPATVAPIVFRAVFSEPVMNFIGTDISLGGTANPSTAFVAEVAPIDGTTYDVSVSGMTGEGTVIASIGAGVAQDLGGTGNVASSSTDNTVAFDVFGATAATAVTINFSGSTASAIGHLEPGDVDFVEFTLATPAQVRISTTGSVDTVGSLFDSGEVLINNPSADDDLGTDMNFQIDRVLSAGTYFVKTEGKGGAQSGGYVLNVVILLNINFQPDGLIGKSAGSLKGGDVYSDSGAGQVQTLVSKKLRKLTFFGRVENDGNASDDLTLTGTRGNKLFKALYFVGGANVTAAVNGGAHVETIDAGNGVVVKLTVKPSGKLKNRRTKKIKKKKKTFSLTAQSTDPAKKDVVKGTAKTK